ncbi:hypothetical protein TGAM01_v207942 [Trichoderma gamsii]|uniref:Uncharacterized protein n=1 Tax=Trichoderma gamsii TaxID=398673 RepID=A0A2P4ZFV2_9HYPO|nr:hypothetical protein TGAM01_v207942 [Trichoderma gamsii]PON23169.1 hypothetical protein TGAM01_v207942 [Trichoderma gamsii]
MSCGQAHKWPDISPFQPAFRKANTIEICEYEC